MSGDSQAREQTFYLTNHGMTCTKVLISMDGREITVAPKIAQGERFEFRRGLRTGFTQAVVTASYLDAHQEEGVSQFAVIETSPGQMKIEQHL